MTPPARRARAAARRAALLAGQAAYRLSGAVSQSLATPGVGLLLLHDTPPPSADRLERYVRAHRARFTGFDSIDAVTRNGAPALTGPARFALTFDDGFANNLDMARRLARSGLSACFYVPTDVVGMDKESSDAFFGRAQADGVLTWADLEEIVRLGHVVGSHSRRHVPLSGLSATEAEDQVKGSLAVLTERLGQGRHYAWPFGTLRHAPAEAVVTWCGEVGAVPASGVRGLNTPRRYQADGYLRRDAADLRWLPTDLEVFTVRAQRVDGP